VAVWAAVGLLVVALLALAASPPPRAAIGRWLREAIGLGAQPTPRPLLAGLPGRGELLVTASDSVWLVRSNGTRRWLGAYAGAAWSPHTRYVVAWRATRLTVLDPRGVRQWSLDAPAAISVARWSADGDRIAYRVGQTLWVVAGDGTGAHPLASAAASVAPAWEPDGAAHGLAFLTTRATIEALDADTGAVLWTLPARGARELLWSPDGRDLLLLAGRRLILAGWHGEILGRAELADDQTITAGAFAPADDRVALILNRPGAQTGQVATLTASAAGLRRAPRILSSAAVGITGLNWSPDGRWLLASAPTSDQWILATTHPPRTLAAISHITADFRSAAASTGFPALAGWQQPPSSR